VAQVEAVVEPPDTVPADAEIELRLNGEIRQQSDRSRFIFTIPELIEKTTRLI
jgi:2-keto-4-pentenoate hydratase/2-oxohepta-3-ene-1,7-dioic acid hydratase in catechol pathway